MSARPEPMSYEALLAEAMAQIPGLCPAWTDHNPSDPGVALIELLAHLTEMLLFQARQVPDDNLRALLQLTRGAAWPFPPGQPIEAAIDETLHALREPYRVVTAADYVERVTVQWPASPEARALAEPSAIRRAHVIVDRDLSRPGAELLPAPGHLSVVLVPAAAAGTRRPAVSPAVLAALDAFLAPRRLLTVHTHVVAASYLKVGVKVRVYLRDDAASEPTRARVQAVLRDSFDPQRGGPGGTGWPLGRHVYSSELLALLDAVPGVDFVEGLDLVTDDAARRIVDGPELVGVRLWPHELVDLDPEAGEIELWGQMGGSWQKIGS